MLIRKHGLRDPNENQAKKQQQQSNSLKYQRCKIANVTQTQKHRSLGKDRVAWIRALNANTTLELVTYSRALSKQNW